MRWSLDDSGGLHVGVDDGRADEVGAALLEVFAEGVGLGRGCGHLFMVVHLLRFGSPSTKRQQKLSKVPNPLAGL